jgi:hypothetical protein
MSLILIYITSTKNLIYSKIKQLNQQKLKIEMNIFSNFFSISRKMPNAYPFEWVDIPKDELKAAMPDAESPYIR